MKVLIVLDNIHTGGISKSLLNLLPNISKYAKCDLCVFNYEKLDKNMIPDDIKIIQPDKNLLILGMSQKEIKEYSKTMFIKRTIYVILSRIFSGDFARHLLFKKMKNLGDYDLAISYSQDVNWKSISTGCNQFVIEKVKAKKKVCYIHCDYEMFGGYNKKQERVFKRFDKIVCVSKSCARNFEKMFAKLKNKCYVCENFTDMDDVNTKLKEKAILYDKKKINFVTVCRLGEEKGIQRTLFVLKQLMNDGIDNFVWTVVGDGPDRKKIEELIGKLNLNNRVKLVGMKKNPYIYMKNADFFLLPSFHEAAPMVFGECVAVGVPIVSTETVSAKELVENRQLGIVCKNNQEGIYNTLKDILTNKTKLNRISKNEIVTLNNNSMSQLEELLYLMGKKG